MTTSFTSFEQGLSEELKEISAAGLWKELVALLREDLERVGEKASVRLYLTQIARILEDALAVVLALAGLHGQFERP